jgi:hypothetical protein
MVLQSFSKVLLMIDYQANKTYIMTFLCINRDKPQLHCEGKCQLAKKIKDQDQSDKNTSGKRPVQELPTNLFCQDLFALPTLGFGAVQDPVAFYRPGLPVRMYPAIFHPPQSLVL